MTDPIQDQSSDQSHNDSVFPFSTGQPTTTKQPLSGQFSNPQTTASEEKSPPGSTTIHNGHNIEESVIIKGGTKKRTNLLIAIFTLLLILGAIPVGVYLVGKNQDIREEATGSCDDYTDPSVCVTCYGSEGSVHEVGRIEDQKGQGYSCWNNPLSCLQGGYSGTESCTVAAGASSCQICKTGPACGGIQLDPKSGNCESDYDGTDCLQCGCCEAQITPISLECNSPCTPTDDQCQLPLVCTFIQSGGVGTYKCKSPDCPPNEQPECVCQTITLTLTLTPTPSPTPTEEITPTTNPSCSGDCIDIKAFDGSWNEIPESNLSNLEVGDSVYFTVEGSVDCQTDCPSGLTKARFNVNGSASSVWCDHTNEIITGTEWCETQNKKLLQGVEYFYIAYTIPESRGYRVESMVYCPGIGWK